MKHILIFTLGLLSSVFSQTLLTDSLMRFFQTTRADIILFDVRNDASPDSILIPCFYTTNIQAIQYADSISCRKIMIAVCHGGILALNVAQQWVAKGWAQDSVFYAGFNNLPSVRRAAKDTLPLSLLATGTTLPVSLTPYELRALMLSKRPHRVVDVRDPVTEIPSGMIPGACNMAWPAAFQAECATLPRDAPVIIYCRSGSRAAAARAHMLSLGYDSSLVINFGGFSRWSDAGFASVTSPTQVCKCLAVETPWSGTPGVLALSVSPNPFNPRVTIRASGLSQNATARIRIMDLQGRKIVEREVTGSFAQVTWDASGFASGHYLLIMESGSIRLTRRLILAR